MEIKIKTEEEKPVASIYHIGPVEEIGEIIGELAEWTMQNQLQITNPPFVVYYTSQVQVKPEEMEYEVGIPFKGYAISDNRVQIKIMPQHKVLYTVHQGPYAEIGPIYAEMMQYIMKEKFEMIGAPREAYLNSSSQVKEQELQIEVIFPVIDLESYENQENIIETGNWEPANSETSYKISPIGNVKQIGMQTLLEINSRYSPGLKELDKFSHLIVLWWADKIENTEYRSILQTYPPYSLDRLTGVFATRAEYRPNPIAVTTCKIENIKESEGIIEVSGIDAYDGTPIIDLKAYIPAFDRVRNPELPKWLSFLWPKWVAEQ